VTDRKGWGANTNKGLRYVFKDCDYVFLCEDDYVALRPLDFISGIRLMEEQRSVGLVRYDGISGHLLNLYLREIKFPVGQMDYMIIDRSSPHLNVYSHRPHLKHRRFHDKYGYYKEGTKLGMTEVEFAHRVKDGSSDQPSIAILPDGILTAFDHIGRSRQGSELDKVV